MIAIEWTQGNENLHWGRIKGSPIVSIYRTPEGKFQLSLSWGAGESTEWKTLELAKDWAEAFRRSHISALGGTP